MTFFTDFDMLSKIMDENYTLKKNLMLIGLFFILTPIIIFTSLFSIISLGKTQISENKFKIDETSVFQIPKSGIRVYASLPNSFPTVSGSAEISDARVVLIRNYLNYYHSPLEKHASDLVSNADQNSLNYKLLTAIAQQESNLCKVIPEDTYNCWGWGIHSKGTLGFNSYEEAIANVSQGIKEEYVDKGYIEIDDIMSKYTPLSNGSWAEGVKKFMTEIEDGSYF